MRIQLGMGLVLLSFLLGLATANLLESPQLPRSPLGPERASPQDWITEENIRVYNDQVIIEIPNAKWASFANTNSMDPLIDTGANGIQVVPTHQNQLEIGDVITYDLKGQKIIHRIVDIQQDNQGTYFIVKGDNNSEPDPNKVRFEDIERVLVAVVY